MKDATTQLRTYYYNTLQGITYMGDAVPVYDNQVNDTVAPFTRDSPPDRYIVITNQNSADESAKCGFQERHTIQVNCYTVFAADNGGFQDAEQINQMVKERILLNTAGAFSLPDYKVYRSRQELSQNISELTKTQNIYRRFTIFNHSIAEN